jgi:hypothetical protein
MENYLLMLGVTASFALINRVRGDGHIGRPIVGRIYSCVMFGLIASLYAAATGSDATVTFTVVALGMFLWAVFGWGKYFSAIHGNDTYDEKEVFWIDAILDFLPKPIFRIGRRYTGMLGMALRGLHAYPMFAVLSYLEGNQSGYLLGLLTMLQGPCYFVTGCLPEKYKTRAVEIAEFATGTILGGIFVAIMQ